MQKITPFLWFDDNGEEAMNFYASVFRDAKVSNIRRYGKAGPGPEGAFMTGVINISGQDFMVLNGGPAFSFNPSVSFLTACKSKEEVEHIWNKLSEGGTALMPLGSYPFSEKYGWIQDKYGLSWQIMYMGNREVKQRFTPTLMFVGDVCGRAEEAINYYTSVFKNSQIGDIMRYGKDMAPDKEGTIQHASFTLAGEQFAAMDSARMHHFSFNEAISFMVDCQTQAEVDYYWEKLSAEPQAEQCGWLVDQFGLSWQIVPRVLGELLGSKDTDKVARVMEVMMKMKKLDIQALETAAAI